MHAYPDRTSSPERLSLPGSPSYPDSQRPSGSPPLPGAGFGWTDTKLTQRTRVRLARIPFLPFVPLLVFGLSCIAAVLIVWMGVNQLKSQSDRAAQLRAQTISQSLSARLRATALEDRAFVIERAASRTGAELLLVSQDGSVVVDGSLSALTRQEIVQLLVSEAGESQTKMGRVRYSASPLGPPLEHLSLLVFVQAPETPYATHSLISSVAFLTVILAGVAMVVGYSVARDVFRDVRFARDRVAEIAIQGAEPQSRLIPIRTIDQVGLLISAFNSLVQRFADAEQNYREDLASAQAHDRDRTAFLAALSHELRTPLNAVLGFTDVLLSEVDGPLTDEARENLQVIRQSGEHLRGLINDILDLSAIESGEFKISRAEINLYDIAAEVVNEARPAARAKALKLYLTGTAAPVFADERRIRQVLGNLIGNAIKFTREGSVHVAVEGDVERSRVSITDTGPGIAKAMQTAIFEAFQQAGDTQSRVVGTGLGLAITRRLVRLHGGVIQLQSTPGRGACFTVFLPSNRLLAPEEPLQSSPISQRYSSPDIFNKETK